MSKILLISMPWATYNMPSVQLGALKAYLQKSKICCDTAHWYFEIARYLGYSNYKSVTNPYLNDGEELYSLLLHRDKKTNKCDNPRLMRIIETIQPGRSISSFLDSFSEFHQRLLDQYNLQDYSIVGFTLNFGQTLASLYIAKEIKKRAPTVSIVFGGAEATAQLGESLLSNFDQVDFACNGEGEELLPNLFRRLARNNGSYEDIPSIIYRNKQKAVVVNDSHALAALDDLPVPDYNEYFNLIERRGESRFNLEIVLPIEASRGCYYKCNFCSLNIQWGRSFRERTCSNLLESIKTLTKTHLIHDLFFVDNIAPINFKESLTKLESSGIDIRYFLEIRANTDLSTFVLLKKTGCSRVQVGIEALSDRLLTKFNKKCRVITNIQCMKLAEIFDVNISANLIVGYPFADQEDIQETIDTIKYCKGLKPPNAFSDYDLQFGSPDYFYMKNRGWIVGNSKKYSKTFIGVSNESELPSKEFRAPSNHVDWGIIKNKVKQWEVDYDQVKIRHGGGLVYFHSKDRLIIHDRRFGEKIVYELSEKEKAIYLYAGLVRALSDVSKKTGLAISDIKQIIQEMKSYHLVYSDSVSVLALATPANNSIERFINDVDFTHY